MDKFTLVLLLVAFVYSVSTDSSQETIRTKKEDDVSARSIGSSIDASGAVAPENILQSRSASAGHQNPLYGNQGYNTNSQYARRGSAVFQSSDADDGSYKPHLHDGGQYSHDESGKYVHSDTPYVHSDNPYVHDAKYTPDNRPYVHDGRYTPDNRPYVHDGKYTPDHKPYIHESGKVAGHSYQQGSGQYLTGHFKQNTASTLTGTDQKTITAHQDQNKNTQSNFGFNKAYDNAAYNIKTSQDGGVFSGIHYPYQGGQFAAYSQYNTGGLGTAYKQGGSLSGTGSSLKTSNSGVSSGAAYGQGASLFGTGSSLKTSDSGVLSGAAYGQGGSVSGTGSLLKTSNSGLSSGAAYGQGGSLFSTGSSLKTLSNSGVSSGSTASYGLGTAYRQGGLLSGTGSSLKTSNSGVSSGAAYGQSGSLYGTGSLLKTSNSGVLSGAAYGQGGSSYGTGSSLKTLSNSGVSSGSIASDVSGLKDCSHAVNDKSFQRLGLHSASQGLSTSQLGGSVAGGLHKSTAFSSSTFGTKIQPQQLSNSAQLSGTHLGTSAYKSTATSSYNPYAAVAPSGTRTSSSSSSTVTSSKSSDTSGFNSGIVGSSLTSNDGAALIDIRSQQGSLDIVDNRIGSYNAGQTANTGLLSGAAVKTNQYDQYQTGLYKPLTGSGFQKQITASSYSPYGVVSPLVTSPLTQTKTSSVYNSGVVSSGSSATGSGASSGLGLTSSGTYGLKSAAGLVNDKTTYSTGVSSGSITGSSIKSDGASSIDTSSQQGSLDFVNTRTGSAGLYNLGQTGSAGLTGGAVKNNQYSQYQTVSQSGLFKPAAASGFQKQVTTSNYSPYGVVSPLHSSALTQTSYNSGVSTSGSSTSGTGAYSGLGASSGTYGLKSTSGLVNDRTSFNSGVTSDLSSSPKATYSGLTGVSSGAPASYNSGTSSVYGTKTSDLSSGSLAGLFGGLKNTGTSSGFVQTYSSGIPQKTVTKTTETTVAGYGGSSVYGTKASDLSSGSLAGLTGGLKNTGTSSGFVQTYSSGIPQKTVTKTTETTVSGYGGYVAPSLYTTSSSAKTGSVGGILNRFGQGSLNNGDSKTITQYQSSVNPGYNTQQTGSYSYSSYPYQQNAVKSGYTQYSNNAQSLVSKQSDLSSSLASQVKPVSPVSTVTKEEKVTTTYSSTPGLAAGFPSTSGYNTQGYSGFQSGNTLYKTSSSQLPSIKLNENSGLLTRTGSVASLSPVSVSSTKTSFGSSGGASDAATLGVSALSNLNNGLYSGNAQSAYFGAYDNSAAGTKSATAQPGSTGQSINQVQGYTSQQYQPAYFHGYYQQPQGVVSQHYHNDVTGYRPCDLLHGYPTLNTVAAGDDLVSNAEYGSLNSGQYVQTSENNSQNELLTPIVVDGPTNAALLGGPSK